MIRVFRFPGRELCRWDETPVCPHDGCRVGQSAVPEFTFSRRDETFAVNLVLYSTLQRELDQFHEAQTYKYEVPLESEQGGRVRAKGRECVMLKTAGKRLGVI